MSNEYHTPLPNQPTVGQINTELGKIDQAIKARDDQIVAAVATLDAARATGDTAEATARASAVAGEATARALAVANEAALRGQGDNALSTQIGAVEASLRGQINRLDVSAISASGLDKTTLTRPALAARIASIGATGGRLTVDLLDASTGFADGDVIQVTGTNQYDGAYTIDAVSTNRVEAPTGLSGTTETVGTIGTLKLVVASTADLVEGQYITVTNDAGNLHGSRIATLHNATTLTMAEPVPGDWIDADGKAASVGNLVHASIEEVVQGRRGWPSLPAAVEALAAFAPRLGTAVAVGATTAALRSITENAITGLVWALFLKRSNLNESEVRRAAVAGDTLTWTSGLSYNHPVDDPVILLWDNETQVGWFGAKGDGVTDDGPAIRRANAQATAAGGVTKFDGRTYLIAKDPAGQWGLAPVDGSYLRGQGMGQTTLKLVGYGPAWPQLDPIFVGTGKRVEISEMKIDGNRAANVEITEQRSNIMLNGVARAVVRNVHSTGANGDGVTIRSDNATDIARNIQLLNMYIDNCARNGVTGGGYGFENILLQGIVFGSDIGTQQIDFEPTDIDPLIPGIYRGVRVIGCHGARQSDGPFTEYSAVIGGYDAANPSLDVQVIANTFRNSVLIRNAQRAVIASNAIDSAHASVPGLKVDYGSADVQILGNSIRAARSAIQVAEGSIDPDGPDGTLDEVEGNIPPVTYYPGRVKIIGNDLAFTGSSGDAGVWLQGAYNSLVMGNMIRGSGVAGTYGVRLHTVSREMKANRVIFNHIMNAVFGVYFQSTNSHVFREHDVSHNHFDDDQGTPTMSHGIYFNATTPLVFDSVMSGNTKNSAIATMAMFRANHQNSYLLSGNIGEVAVWSVYGTPEGAIVAAIGSAAHRRDGGAGTSFYVKQSGALATGWVGK